jgi:DinB superfamily
VIPLLRWQFDLVWSLLELHLDALGEDDHVWEPAPGSWTVRRGDDGLWRADWVEPEPEPPPASTIAWVTWHIGWWWGETIDRLAGAAPPAREDVTWPGDGAAAVGRLRELRKRWIAVLAGLSDADLGRTAPFPWRDRPDRTVAHTVGWVNAELMKNTAEIGQLRMLRAALSG